ncbi:TetR/AcrR family transcriptional regulator [Clostridium sp. 19966]|uniref:hypothetical protein n=1 Tax=Clostridium sp. 19966 TaxID=2768166 RepID=UPI0028DE5EF6|nr:hypothetical protein [Clostridium sp. 19966]MDT8719251.1 TetR/AcrR family transcriptional regulator [Clostridium sp. 19966]
MPPKPAITKGMIDNEAFQIVRESGMDALTARNLAKRLNCSTQPIYSICKSMEHIKNHVYAMAVEFVLSNMKEYRNEKNSPALNLCLGYLNVTKNEKQLFKSVYLSGYKTFDLSKDRFIGEELSTSSLRHSKRLKDIDEDTLRKIYLKLNIYVMGIASMINTDTIKITMEEAGKMVKDMYELLLCSEISNGG